jgi:hypothetical protein
MLNDNASGPEIGLPSRISAGFYSGRPQPRPSGRPKAAGHMREYPGAPKCVGTPGNTRVCPTLPKKQKQVLTHRAYPYVLPWETNALTTIMILFRTSHEALPIVAEYKTAENTIAKTLCETLHNFAHSAAPTTGHH